MARAIPVEALEAQERAPARPWAGFWRWLDERLGLDALSYPVPAHANSLAYTLGGITAFGMLVLVVTGVYLAQFYHPHPADARDSVIYIVDRARLGEFMRSVHFWTANLVVITVLLHLVRVYVTGAYKPPREVNWLVGLAMFAVTLGLVFTGSVLKWDQEGWEALQHNQEIGKLLGGLGSFFTNDFTSSVPLLNRLYVAHIAIMPMLLFALLGLHFWLVKRHGVSSPPGRDEARRPGQSDTEAAIQREGSAPFSSHLRHILGYGLLLTALGGALTLFYAAPLGPEVEPGIEVTKPPWMFLPLYPFEDWFGVRALLVAPMVLFGLLATVPFLDGSPFRALRQRKLLLLVGMAFVLALVALAIYARVSTPEAHVMEG